MPLTISRSSMHPQTSGINLIAYRANSEARLITSPVNMTRADADSDDAYENTNKWSTLCDLRPHRRRARIVPSYSQGGTNVHLPPSKRWFFGPTRVCITNSRRLISIG